MSVSIKRKRANRSPKYPFIPLEKALARANVLREKEGKHSVSVPTALQDWEYSPKSSGGFQTVAALKMYGLLEDEGSGENRKVRISDRALRYFMEERQHEKAALLKEFARQPKIMQELLNRWGTSPPSEAECRSQLKVELNFSENAASDVLSIYRDNVNYADLADSDTVPIEDEEPEGDSASNDYNDREDNEAGPLVGGQTPPPQKGKVRVMEGERIVFTEENDPENYVKIVASGNVDENLLDALSNYIERQKKRLGLSASANDPRQG